MIARPGVPPSVPNISEQLTGIDIGKASTYDAGGGHRYADHGAHTTKSSTRRACARASRRRVA